MASRRAEGAPTAMADAPDDGYDLWRYCSIGRVALQVPDL